MLKSQTKAITTQWFCFEGLICVWKRSCVALQQQLKRFINANHWGTECTCTRSIFTPSLTYNDIDLPLKTSLHTASPLSQTYWQVLKDAVLKAMPSGSLSPKLCVEVGASTFMRKKTKKQYHRHATLQS